MKKSSVRRFYPVRERGKASTKVENKALKRRKSLGQGVVEFALVAPLLLLTIFGIIDIARIIQAQVTVNNAARQAIRFAITGQTLKDAGGNYIPRAQSITDLAVAGLAGLPLTNTDDPLQWRFNRVRITSSNGDEGDPGQPNEVVRIEVVYTVKPLTPLVSAIIPGIELKGVEMAINERSGARCKASTTAPRADPSAPRHLDAGSILHANSTSPGNCHCLPANRGSANDQRRSNCDRRPSRHADRHRQGHPDSKRQGYTNVSGGDANLCCRVYEYGSRRFDPNRGHDSTQTAGPPATQTAIARVTQTAIAGSTNTAVAATQTAGAPTSTRTNTPSNTPPSRLRPTNTPTATNTVPVTATFTRTKTPTPTVTPTFTKTNTPTNTPSNTPTPTVTPTPIPLRVSIIAYKSAGRTEGLYIQVRVTNFSTGAPIDGATVSAAASNGQSNWSGTLGGTGSGYYTVCNVGSFSNDGWYISVNATASKPGYVTSSATLLHSSNGNLLGCP